MAFTPIDPTKAEVRTTQTGTQLAFDFYIPRGAKGEPGGIVLGTALGTTDLNTIKVAGTYHQGDAVSGTLVRNYPKDILAGNLLVQGGGTLVKQLFFPINGAYAGRVFYSRQYNTSAWTTWSAHSSARVDETAGRAIYQWDDKNNREQLVYGDTGVRALTMDNGFLGSLLIRRSNNMVTLYGSVKRPPGLTLNAVFLSLVPVGFQPAAIAWTFYPVRHNGSSAYFSLYRRNTELLFEGAGTEADASECRFELNWTTTQTWPTTLPGTASGTIPNA